MGKSGVKQRFLVALLWILHSIVTSLIFLSLISRRALAHLKHWYRGGSVQRLELRTKVSKLPRHIAFLLIEKDISLSHLARLVVWSVQAGIRVVSLFDSKGRLKACQEELLMELHNHIDQDEGQLSVRVRWQPHLENGSPLEELNGGSNGNGGGNGKSGKKEEICVALLGPEDGKEDVAKAARKLAEEVARGERQVEEVTQEALGESLDTCKGLPDPCLVVTLGPASSTAQFPPWQLRLSEIHRLPSHKGLLPGDLEGILTSYANCQQRFGR